jgi:hypothetical protein
MSSSWSRVVDHARTHHATVTPAAALTLGVSDRDMSRWAELGRLVRQAPGVYVVAGAPDTWHQRVSVATGSAAGWASHRTAAAIWDLDGFPPRHVEVLVPHGRWRRRGDWIVHETRNLRGVDLDEVDGIPCTSVARTLLDSIAVAHPFVVGLALDHACRRWPRMLEVVVQRHLELPRRGRRGSRIMSEMLDERLGRGRFTDSGFETRALRLVSSIGLPEPVLQHTVRDGDFVAHLDLAWPTIKWAIECDSLAHHSGKRAHEWDRQRRRRLKQLGWDIVEVTYDDVTKRTDDTGAELRALYNDRLQAASARAHRRYRP